MRSSPAKSLDAHHGGSGRVALPQATSRPAAEAEVLDRRDLLAPGPARPGVRTTARSRSAHRRASRALTRRRTSSPTFRVSRRSPGNTRKGSASAAKRSRWPRSSDIDEIRAHALNNIGIARVGERRRGRSRRPGAKPSRSPSPPTPSRAFARTATSPRCWRTSASSSGRLPCGRRRRRLGERFGVGDWLLWIEAEAVLGAVFSRVDWDEAARPLDEFIAEFEEDRYWMETPLHEWLRGRIRLARGDTARGAGGRRAGARARQGGKGSADPLARAGIRARVRSVATDPRRAGALAAEFLSDWQSTGWPGTSESDWPADIAVVLVPQLAAAGRVP